MSTLRPSALMIAIMLSSLCVTASVFAQNSGPTPISSGTQREASVEPTKPAGSPDAAVITLPPSIADPTTVDSFSKLSIVEQFEELRKYRNRLVYANQTLNNQLSNADAQLKELLQLKKEQDARPASTYEEPKKSDLENRRKQLEVDIKDTEERISNPSKYKLSDDDVKQLTSTLVNKRSSLDSFSSFLDSYDERKAQRERFQSERDRIKQQTETGIASLRAQLAQGHISYDQINRQLSDADEKIASLFGRTDAVNWFRQITSGIFAGLVGLVILGFFWIAGRDETVRRAIFSNESGIQFITLFALVIAIILFGIVQVLEGKELAALLGGLSGYILGRGTAKPA